MTPLASNLGLARISKRKPVFGDSYAEGWLGFVRSFGFVSDAIEYGERWERDLSYPSVTHVLIVAGPGACVEAHADSGVRLANLSEYLTDPKCKIYFRQPSPFTPALGACIAADAKSQVGSSYDDLLIAEQALSDTLAGHWINRVLGGLPHRVISAFMARPRDFICSYLGAYALAGQPQFAGRDCLAGALSAIDPQTLFESSLFEPFINDCSFQT